MGSQKCQWSGRPKTDNRLKNMSALTKYNTCLDICLLVGALSQVNHKGLHQGWTQTSFYLQVNHFTSRFITSHFFLEPIYIPRALNTGTCIQEGEKKMPGVRKPVPRKRPEYAYTKKHNNSDLSRLQYLSPWKYCKADEISRIPYRSSNKVIQNESILFTHTNFNKDGRPPQNTSWKKFAQKLNEGCTRKWLYTPVNHASHVSVKA